ncbi:unnamed protein product [Leptidea sinapis]|uniref:G-protein coupled receptors family 1 profile domain-containing protein n=1 Tax=Leptidea sinapis TaxID=189913 RepID=A0A5E4QW30_9NEOP|nr:unnamed protein product [Leptidea sinapis]
MPMGAIPGFLASIMHMCFISIGSRHHSTKRVVVIKIALVWLLSMVVSSSITVLGLINKGNIMPTPELCVINNRLFWIFGSLVAFYIPMLTMVVSFALTVQLLKRQAILAATPVPGGTQRRQCGAFDNSSTSTVRRLNTRSSPDLSPGSTIGMSVSHPQLSYINGCGNGMNSGTMKSHDVS